MTTPPTSPRPERPHLVSLVLQSKKALQHGEQSAVDVLALDAKVKWITDAVTEQLKLATSVAKCIEEKRVSLRKQVQTWDALRTKHTDSLEKMLESLGSQLVPPEFHQNSADSSLFGSQRSDQVENGSSPVIDRISVSPQRSLSSTVRGIRKEKKHSDRKGWKTLRDFVDDQAIEDILETIENERISLEDVLIKTEDYPETLTSAIRSIRSSLPHCSPAISVEGMLTVQDTARTSMAVHLESLASHFEQMAGALQDSEAGETFSEEDLQDMNRDTEELPSIMAELEESATLIESHHEQLITAQHTNQTHLQNLQTTLNELEELGDIMSEMLQTQEEVETKCEEDLDGLQQHLLTLEHLDSRFLSYQTSFSKLILEMARRRQYREAAENIVVGMMAQLEAMTKEESEVRDRFNLEHGAHLPEDICLCIGNPPTRWEVVPHDGEIPEILPDIDDDLIVEARDKSLHLDIDNGVDSV
ncbi:autophagy-related protein 17 [Infundibulicybe gibba]|nr:autophagy-related protein 17 [Infundibulicybe gibba]